jgi:hypothetical protein
MCRSVSDPRIEAAARLRHGLGVQGGVRRIQAASRAAMIGCEMRGPAVAILAAGLLSVVLLAACAPRPQPGSLPPPQSRGEVRGGRVAFQNGIPVPTSDRQPRQRLDLGGTWRVERHTFDADVSLTDRDEALPLILAEADGREQAAYDHDDWERLPVPGTLNPPPEKIEMGAWYRRGFSVPGTWSGMAVTLKFGAVNYIGDVWVNGEYQGYHEGGYTPFAFDVTDAILPGERNVIAVRVDNPAWGTRNDIVPWGLTDWWNYGGITQPVWLEASAPLYAVRVLNNAGSGSWSDVICGVDWVTANAASIKVANMSLGGSGSAGTSCTSSALRRAICNSVNAGVAYVVAAGNSAADAAGFVPAAYPETITVAALADFDGRPGGEASPTCRNDVDDTVANFSNYGSVVDLIAPGVCITSTWHNGG